MLPVLLLLLLGVTEISRALVRSSALTKAVQDGARYAAASPSSAPQASRVDAQLQTEVRDVVVYGTRAAPAASFWRPQPAQITWWTSGATGSVDASYPYQPILGPVLPNLGLGSSIAPAS